MIVFGNILYLWLLLLLPVIPVAYALAMYARGKRVAKLGDEPLVRELALVKIRVDAARRAEALQIADHFRAKTMDLTETSMILQATGSPSKLDAMVGLLRKFEIVELVRTGKVLMARGEAET